MVPGGPCDRSFNGKRIEIGDTILRVDGKANDFLLGLVGDDVVGSQVTLTIQKRDLGNYSFDCVVERAALSRIHAVGQLFLLLSELIADIEVNQRQLTAQDMLRVEDKAKIVNDVTNIFIKCFKSHVHDLEDALFEFWETTSKETERRTTHLQGIANEKSAEAGYLAARVEELESQLREGLQKESRRDRTVQALQNQVETVRIELEASKRVCSSLDTQVRDLIIIAEEANKEVLHFKTKLAQTQVQLSFAGKKSDDLKQENSQLMQEIELLKRKASQEFNDERQTAINLRGVCEDLRSELNSQTQETAKLMQDIELLKQKASQELKDEQKRSIKLGGDCEHLRSVLNSLTQENSKLIQDIELLKQRIAQASKEFCQTATNYGESARELNSLTQENGKLMQDIELLNQRIAKLMEEKKNLARELDKSEVMKARTSHDLDEEQKKVADRVEECNALRAELNTLKEKLIESTSDYDSRVRQLMQEIEVSKQQTSQELKDEKEKGKKIRSEFEDERKKVTDGVKECEALRAELNIVKEKLIESTSAYDAKVRQWMQDMEVLTQKIAHSSKELQDERETAKKLLEEIATLKQEKTSLAKELEEERKKICKQCKEGEVEKSLSIAKIEMLQKRLVLCSQELEDERKKFGDIVKEREALREEHAAAAIHKPKLQLI